MIDGHLELKIAGLANKVMRTDRLSLKTFELVKSLSNCRKEFFLSMLHYLMLKENKIALLIAVSSLVILVAVFDIPA